MQPVPTLSRSSVIVAIALLALGSYLPVLNQPFIEDDYPNILQARVYGPIAGWKAMAHDHVNRVRATTFVLTHLIERTFGLRPVAFYTFSILLHVLNCWLLYALGRWPIIGYRASAWSAAFYAVHEGHQEAVMWYSACSELLLFFFGVLAFLCWLIFLEERPRRWLWYLASLAFFSLAFLSKESSVVFAPLLFLPLLTTKLKPRRILFFAPFATLAIVSAISILQTSSYSFRFYDKSFEMTAPFWETWTGSFFALLLPWGWLAI